MEQTGTNKYQAAVGTPQHFANRGMEKGRVRLIHNPDNSQPNAVSKDSTFAKNVREALATTEN